ncbi:putative leucine-rich repeat receptor-like serine/threonine-protein kinase [Zea mays]|uniref:Putative leucine-rich repeat receptor-like serine/threonine-protein kinase n=1 Tax=Zea mays TaxID=4577 RepID=A0A3L6E1F4_MAIZE|nr:putative leucine-rich repeat receptor-like serine/threonine-protein kinase [Zea mays]
MIAVPQTTVNMALAFLVLLLLFAPVAVSQQGFLSIDCGLDADSSGYTDKVTGIVYVSDGSYVDAGENHRIAPDLEGTFEGSSQTLRSFPSGQRNCYALPTVAGTRYLARATFAYGNYDGKNSSALEFDLHLGANYWQTVYPNARSSYGPDWLPAYRPTRLTVCGRSVFGCRYPDDPYDRFWWAMDEASPRWVNLSTTRPIQPDTSSYAVPSRVLQTAVAAASNNGTAAALTAMNWQYDTKYSFMIFLHFTDFVHSQIRQFDILINENESGPKVTAYNDTCYLIPTHVHTESYRAAGGKYNVTLAATKASVLPPMLNALEIYVRVPYESPTTLPQDQTSPTALCMAQYLMILHCSQHSRICKCYLTAGQCPLLSVFMSQDFTLHDWDLSYNKLSGSIPDSLPTLPSLRVLNVSGNQLSDESLCKNYTGPLIFSSDLIILYTSRRDFDGSVCNKPSSSPSRNKVAIIAISVVVPVLVLIVLLTYFIWWQKRKPIVTCPYLILVQPVPTHGSTRDPEPDNASGIKKSYGYNLNITENRQFTYKELEKFTNNFKKFIGQGGFGPVYYGRLEDDTEVAVKMRSESSSHGLDEFLAEVQSLTKVHHRNLVSLIGYCWEEDHLALVYEYMPQGSLFDHLRGKNGVSEALNWRKRVQVVLEAAQGLDYLHKGCSLPIVHRDVKTNNILLGQNLQAKIADFGLSKTYLSDTQTHISVTPAGTAGYMDPE